MKIIRTECFMVLMPLSEPYTIAYETISECRNLFLIAHTDNGLTGFGCAAPDSAVTGETAEDCLSKYNSLLEPLLKNSEVFNFINITETLKTDLEFYPSVLAMTDMMLFDLVSKKAGVPLYKYLGAFRNSIPTSITIPILSLDESINRAGEYLKKGFKYIKIKGGLNVDDDIEKFIKIRELCGKQICLLFDANQGYTINDTVKFAKETLSLNVELIEQPTPRDKPEMLGKIKNLISVPVMADESLMNLADAYNLGVNKYCDMINIKLMKAGGISEALSINSIAKAAGMKCMVGCMDESELSISASLHFALSRPNISYTDLDGHFDLINDPASGAFTVREGVLWPDSSPGLGIDKLKF